MNFMNTFISKVKLAHVQITTWKISQFKIENPRAQKALKSKWKSGIILNICCLLRIKSIKQVIMPKPYLASEKVAENNN